MKESSLETLNHDKHTSATDVRPPDHRNLPAAVTDTPPRRGKKGRWIILLIVAGGAVFAWTRFSSSPAEEKHMGRGGEGGPIPVVACTVEQRDFPLELNGLGTVQAYNSVIVRARVDGEIQQIFFQEGQTVQKGAQLAQIDPRPYQSQYDQAVAKMAQDQAQLSNARIMMTRNEQLHKNGVIDEQTYDTQKYSVDQLAALVKADQAAVDNTQTQLDYTRLLSPITGRVGIRQVDEGNIVHASDANGIVVINQVQPISVVFTLPQQQLGAVRDALKSNQNLKVTALDRNNLSSLADGTLAVVDNQIDQTTATVKLKATFSNDNLSLWPGQFVNVELLLGVKQGAICVPTAAIQRGPDGSFVYVIQPDQTVEMQTIKPGADENGWTMVNEGLKAGDQIVEDGQYKLKPGAKIILSTADQAPAAADASKTHRHSGAGKKTNQ
jgi:membrane fusion protein, multidrug efflux system